MPSQIPDAVLDLRVTGVQLVPGTPRDRLRGGPPRPATEPLAR